MFMIAEGRSEIAFSAFLARLRRAHFMHSPKVELEIALLFVTFAAIRTHHLETIAKAEREVLSLCSELIEL